jgi:pimeloyl-ACP methyl ester carboxylesterase
MRRTLLAALTAVAVTCAPAIVPGSAVASTSGSASAAGSRTSVAWTACDPAELPGLDCALVEVPLSHDRPRGRTIKIASTRKRHTVSDDRYQGVLLINPGGPGASGRAAPLWFQGGPVAAAAAAYDLIGFDPRGVGASQPRLVCGSSYDQPVRPGYVPASVRDETAWLGRAASFARACATSYGWLLPYMRTEDSARDLDAIRIALGQDKISYLGYSWGTYLGAVYGTLFPGRVHRLVLDSVVRPSGVWYADNLDQNRSMQGRIGDFFVWVASYDAVYHLGTDPAAVERKYYEARGALKAAPAQGRVGPSELDDTYLAAGYVNTVWHGLALALSGYLAGDDELLVRLYEAITWLSDDGTHAAYLATTCADARWPRDYFPTWHRDMVASHRVAPFATWENTWFNAPCAFWPTAASKPPRITGRGLPPILLLQATKDGATPYGGAVETHALLPSSRLVVEEGGGNHGISLAGNECVDGRLAAYLADGSVPASVPGPDAVCATNGDPPPPDAMRSAASGRSALRLLGPRGVREISLSSLQPVGGRPEPGG